MNVPSAYAQMPKTKSDKPTQTDKKPAPPKQDKPKSDKTTPPSGPVKTDAAPFTLAPNGGVGPLAAPPGPKLTAEEWEKKGREALQARKFDDAIQAFKAALLVKPNDSAAFFGLGMAYEAKRQYADAAKAFQALASLNPTNVQAHALLAQALAEANQTNAALQALKRAIELSPDTADLYMQQGGLYLQQKETRAAQQAYLQALGAAPDDPRAHIGLADTYEQDGRHAAALDEYEAALRLDVNNISARLGLATTLGSLKRMKEAEALLTKTTGELDITETQLRARLAMTTGDARAQALLQAQLAQLPTQKAAVHTTFAQILDTAQRRDEAIKEYQAALKITPESATTWGNLGWTQYEAGQYDAAIQSSRKALELDTSLAYVRLNLGLLFAVQNRWPEAQKEYKDALNFATVTDINAGMNDARDALVKQPASRVLQQALAFLSQAAEKAGRGAL